MADQIRVQYDEMAQISTKFANQAEIIQELMTRLTSQVSDLEGGRWIGVGANAFYNEMGDLVLPAMTKLQEALESSSVMTQQITRMVQDAEEEAGALFAQNT